LAEETKRMASRPAGAGILNPLDTLFRLGVVGDLSDQQLLHRFLTAGDGADQAAFTELVQRHGAMVLGVCREVLGNAHDAQDAFQATFLVLARKAGSVRKAGSLSCWLHGVAYRVALRARSNAVRRRNSEQQAGAMKAVALQGEQNRAESWPELHEEVARLPKHYREPIVLCYLEGLSTEEAALRIGCPAGTVFSRLSRARERLRERLVRRGLAPPAALFAAGLTRPARAFPPASLLKSTVQTSIGFSGRRAADAATASAAATAMARGVLHAMMISRLKTLGAAILAGAVAMGGAQTLSWIGVREQSQPPATTVDPQAALTRSIEKLESELEATARRNAEMKRELQEIRGRLKALRPAGELALAQEVAARLADEPSRSVARLAEALKRHPARRIPKEGDRLRLYMMDLVEGGTTLIADEPDPGLTWCGTPKWSHDGTRIIFFAWPWPQYHSGRIMAIELRDGLPTCTDLGAGNSPNFSPNDKRIVFGLAPGSQTGAEPGVWVMQADGSERRQVSDYYGAPFWSPDGREFLINDYSDGATQSMVINVERKESGILKVPGHQIFSWPSWVGPGTVVSALATGQDGDSIALLDVRKPAEAKIIEVLWKRSNELDVTPRWPVYQPDKRRLFFVGVEPMKRTLFSVQHGDSGRATRVESRGFNDRLSGLSFSPDGRYLLFTGDRPGQK
jgi:RNA polymerase sigma factor (sigma-70 family)